MLPLVAAKSTSSSGSYVFILVVLAAYGAFYFLYFRPRRQKQRQYMMANRKFEVGDKVMTNGGLIATAVSMDDFTVTVRTESGTELTFVRQAIAQKYVPPTPPDEHTDGTAEGAQT